MPHNEQALRKDDILVDYYKGKRAPLLGLGGGDNGAFGLSKFLY